MTDDFRYKTYTRVVDHTGTYVGTFLIEQIGIIGLYVVGKGCQAAEPDVGLAAGPEQRLVWPLSGSIRIEGPA